MRVLLHRASLALLLALLAGCASTTHRPADASPFWSGRLALQVDGTASQSFSASFELKGSPEQGELTLFNPLGGIAARLVWQPGLATLQANGAIRPYDSLETLAEQATGSPIPLAALLDWLHGKNTAVPGWQADLSRLDDGRLTALRHQPLPSATLRLVLDK